MSKEVTLCCVFLAILLALDSVFCATAEVNLTAQQLSSSSLDISASGLTPGSPAVLEASSDLRTWTGVLTNLSDQPFATFRVTGNAASEFYRLIQSGTPIAPGIWLESKGVMTYYGTNGGAWRGAYADALPGDTLHMGVGTYYIGWAFLTKPVHIVGSGAGPWDRSLCRFNGGTILEGSVQVMPGMTNVLLANFAIQGAEDLFMWNVTGHDIMNDVCQNIATGSTSHANNHNIEITGCNIEVVGMRSYNSGFHGIVFKGVSNVVARQLYSWNDAWSGVLIKSDTNKFDAVNIDISDIVVDSANCPNSPIHIQTYAAGTACRNVSVRNARIFCNRSSYSALYVDALPAGSVSENIRFSDILVDNAPLILFQCYDPTNISVVNCQVDGYFPRLNCPFGIAPIPRNPTQLTGRNIRVGKTVLDQDGFIRRSKTTLNGASEVSVGLKKTVVKNARVVNGSLFIGWPKNYPITNSLTPGDPVWITEGPLMGIYRFIAAGISSSDGDPFPAAQGGDFWMRCGPGTTPLPASGNYDCGDVYPGKVLGVAWNLATGKGASIEVNAGGRHSVANTWESAAVMTGLAGGQSSATTIFGNTTQLYTNSTVMPLYPMLWSIGAQTYIGVFGGGSPTPPWYPSCFYEPTIEVTTRGFPLTISQTNSW